MNKLENKIDLFNKDLSMILASLAYHIHRKIVEYIVEKNKEDFNYFEDLFDGRIDINDYLFDGSDCVFPGIRRYISGEGQRKKYNIEYKAIIDDNTFPRHIWCFLINGKPYTGSNWTNTNLNEFELAHIFTHKKPEKKEIERFFFKEFDDKILPYGAFTSAANVVLLPKGTVRPTDNSEVLKSVFYKRHIELYGENTLSGRKGFVEDKVDWYADVTWNDPFLPNDWKKNIDKLLEYRRKRITEIMQQ